MGRKLIRTMKGEDVDGVAVPVLGENINRTLGVRHRTASTDPEDKYFDIVTEDDGTIVNLRQGLSVAPPPKENMRKHLLRLRPSESYFCIDEDFLATHDHLVYIEDTVLPGEIAKHGIIAPRYKMSITTYISYLSATRGFWEVLHDEVNAEIGTQSALDRQLHAESKGVHYRSNK